MAVAVTKVKTGDSPQIGHPPDPEKPVTLRPCPVSGKELGRTTVRPSPQKLVNMRTCPI
jgi:hypothetical protein